MTMLIGTIYRQLILVGNPNKLPSCKCVRCSKAKHRTLRVWWSKDHYTEYRIATSLIREFLTEYDHEFVSRDLNASRYTASSIRP